MTEAPIGYYVHHHGEGHRRRAVAIAAEAPGRFTLIGAGVAGLHGPFETLELPDDRALNGGPFDGVDGCAQRPASLHYAPVDHQGVRDRARIVSTWIAERRPAIIVVDVSVEIAMLARLCATPTLVVRLAGDRTDPAHLDAFRSASALLAPYDARLDGDDVPDWVRRKTIHVAGLGRGVSCGDVRDNVVVAAFGRGGTGTALADLVEAASATSASEWRVLGPLDRPLAAPENLRVLGWMDEPGSEIAKAGVVVGGAGDGVLGEVAAAARPFVCIPEARPYGEQTAKAARLKALGAAIVRPTWPRGPEWPGLLREAKNLDTRHIAGLHDPKGAAAAADAILRFAA